MTLADEKISQKELRNLQKSLPHVEPFSAATTKSREIEKEKRKVQKEINVIFNNEINPCKKELKEIDARIDLLYKEKKEKSKENEPEVKEKKSEFNAQIDVLEKEKDQVYEDWDKKWDAYYDQFYLIKRLAKMKEIQVRLIQEKKWQD